MEMLHGPKTHDVFFQKGCALGFQVLLPSREEKG